MGLQVSLHRSVQLLPLPPSTRPPTGDGLQLLGGGGEGAAPLPCNVLCPLQKKARPAVVPQPSPGWRLPAPAPWATWPPSGGSIRQHATPESAGSSGRAAGRRAKAAGKVSSSCCTMCMRQGASGSHACSAMRRCKPPPGLKQANGTALPALTRSTCCHAIPDLHPPAGS